MVDGFPSGIAGGLLRETLLLLYDILSSVLIVAIIVGFIAAISGIWPPLVAIESGSMEPHINKGDLAFVMEEHRLVGETAVGDTGIIPYQKAKNTGYQTFQEPGDVIVYEPNGKSSATPIIHRARFYVEKGENWVKDANESWLRGADSCDDLKACPAPHDGFITGGDNNGYYDQTDRDDLSTVVKPEWIIGRAISRIPYLGKIRLRANAVSRDLSRSARPA
ncbi:MAG: S26 family signal peptidase [Halococcoides sp.]